MERLEITNLNLPLDESDASQDEVVIVGQIQRIPHCEVVNGELGYGDDPFVEFWNEIWRILKPGGVVQVVAPYYTSAQSVLFPRQIGELTFMQLGEEWRKTNNWTLPFECNFTVEKLDYNISPEFQGRAQDAIQYLASHSWNVITDISAVLRKPAET